MPGGVIPDSGERRMLETMLGLVAPESLELRLYVNNKVPALTDVPADYVEMDSHGYAPKVLAAIAWTVTPASAGLNTPARAVTALQSFVFPDAGPELSVYGYYFVGTVSGELWGAERFSDGPYRVLNPSDFIEVTPYLRAGTEYA